MRGSWAAYRGGVPDKRQTSKQKRAARNRAQREALAARRENAATPARSAVTTPRTGGSTTSGSGSSRAATAVADAAAPRPPGLAAYRKDSRRPGDFAVICAVLLAMVGLALSLQASVTVDDRGEALPLQFGGVALDARAILTGQSVDSVSGKENVVSLYGFPIVAMMLVPVLVVIAVMVMNFRRADQRSRLLTFGMVAVAAVVFLAGPNGIYFLGALVALLVASFQVRKVEAPQREAEMAARREARATRGRGGAIDVDEVDADAEADEPAEAPARSARSRRSRAARRATTAEAEATDAEVIDAEEVDVVDVDADVDADADADAVDADGAGPAAEPEPAATPSDDDILAELEEELRRESEADDGDDGDDGPTPRR